MIPAALLEWATVRSQIAISLFLRRTGPIRTLARYLITCWDTRTLYTMQSLYRQHAGHRPRLEMLIDLTSLGKSGEFAALIEWIHPYNGVRDVHMVLLYLSCGPLWLP